MKPPAQPALLQKSEHENGAGAGTRGLLPPEPAQQQTAALWLAAEEAAGEEAAEEALGPMNPQDPVPLHLSQTTRPT